MRSGAVRAAIVAGVLGTLAAGPFDRLTAAPLDAQQTRPRATLRPLVAEVDAAPGASLALALEVTMPPEVHVQAHKPADDLLIPTVLSVDAPPGITVESIAYPQPVPFAQQGRPDPLLVLGPTFEIAVRLAVVEDATPGLRSIPVVLRYQACNDTLCFPPARATAAWAVRVRSEK